MLGLNLELSAYRKRPQALILITQLISTACEKSVKISPLWTNMRDLKPYSNSQHNLVFSALLCIIPRGLRVPCWTLIWFVVLFCFCPDHQKRTFSSLPVSLHLFRLWIFSPSFQPLLRHWLEIWWNGICSPAVITPSQNSPLCLRTQDFVVKIQKHIWLVFANSNLSVFLLSAFLLKHCLLG